MRAERPAPTTWLRPGGAVSIRMMPSSGMPVASNQFSSSRARTVTDHRLGGRVHRRAPAAAIGRVKRADDQVGDARRAQRRRGRGRRRSRRCSRRPCASRPPTNDADQRRRRSPRARRRAPPGRSGVRSARRASSRLGSRPRSSQRSVRLVTMTPMTVPTRCAASRVRRPTPRRSSPAGRAVAFAFSATSSAATTTTPTMFARDDRGRYADDGAHHERQPGAPRCRRLVGVRPAHRRVATHRVASVAQCAGAGAARRAARHAVTLCGAAAARRARDHAAYAALGRRRWPAHRDGRQLLGAGVSRSARSSLMSAAPRAASRWTAASSCRRARHSGGPARRAARAVR